MRVVFESRAFLECYLTKDQKLTSVAKFHMEKSKAKESPLGFGNQNVVSPNGFLCTGCPKKNR